MKRDDLIGMGLVAGCIIAASALLAFLSSSHPPAVDEQTLCPVDSNAGRTVVVVDKSDRWGQSGTNQLGNLLDELYSGLPEQRRLTVKAILGEGRDSTRVRTLFDKCNPGSDDQCNYLYQSCESIRAQYQESFRSQLDTLTAELKKPGESSYSPLLEAIANTLHENGTQATDIHLISDMVENGNVFRFYDVVPLPEEMVARYPLAAGVPVSVRVHRLQRQRYSSGMQRAVDNAWREYFQSQDIDVVFNTLLVTE